VDILNPDLLIEEYDIAHNEYQKKGFVNVTKFFGNNFFRRLESEITSLKNLKIRKDFTMPIYETPRNLSVIGGGVIKDKSQFLNGVYSSSELNSLLRKIIKKNIFKVNHKEEFIVINFLSEDNDTHGWHLDDPDVALVFIVNSPKNKKGGNLELVRNFYENEDEKIQGQFVFEQKNILSYTFNDHEAYLLNASKILHRVTPLVGKDFRSALNFAYSYSDNQIFGETADLLYTKEKESEYV